MSDEQQIHQPGKHEAEALVAMNEVERPDTSVTKHVVAHRETSGFYVAHAWNRQTRNWEPARGLVAMASHAQAVEFLAGMAPFANVAITDRCIDYAELEGVGLADFDACAFYENRGVLCPEGIPKAPDGWTSVRLGRGTPSLSAQHRFPKVSLAEQFRDSALQQRSGAEAPTVVVRHDVAARDLAPKERWGIVGRPDLTARTIDDELRRDQEKAEETQRLIEQPGGFVAHRRQQQIDRQMAADRTAGGR